jgi:nitrate/nitrite-specific signal transduction histidine kinase
MKKTWWRRLRIKIVAWSFVPTVIILSAVAWFTFYSYQRVIGDLAIKQDWAVAQSKAVEAHTALADLFNTLIRPIILTIDIDYEKLPEARAQNILDQTQDLDKFDGGIYFLDQQGKVFKTQPPQPELIGQDWSDTPQFRFLAENPPGSSPVTDIRTIGPNGRAIICATWPMHNTQREFIGAGYYCLEIGPTIQGALHETLSNLDLGSDVYIIDGYQKIVFSPNLSLVGKDISQEPYIQQLLQDPKMSIRSHKEAEDMVISYYPLANVVSDRLRWVLIKEQSLAEIMQPSLPYRRLLLVLLALGVIVPALVTAYGVRHITGPILKLTQATEQVGEGQFNHRIEVQTGDEIETLADRFNVMATRLDDSYASLEKKVADRTRELAVVNAIISVASQSLDIHEILEQALDETVEQMGFEAGAAFRPSEVSGEAQLVAQQGFEPTSAHDLARCCNIASQAGTAEAAPQVITYTLDEHPENSQALQLAQTGFNLLVSVPLSTKGHTLGLFLLGRREAAQLSPEELSLLSTIGQQIGVAIENAHLYEQAEEAATTAERHRLARELHDAVTQTLFSANLIADVLPLIWKRNPEEGLHNLEELRQLTRGALAEMRTLLLEMRPESLERMDLKSLLTQLAEAFIGRVRVPVSLDIQGNCELPHEVKLVYYRVAQESLNNIAKHSGSRQVELHLECKPGQLKLCVQDDGLGFDLKAITPGHIGIAIMRERASSIGASLKIESQVGQGTTVELDWRPVQKEAIDEYTSDDPRNAGG